MTKFGITLRLLAVSGAAAGGWFTAPLWQAQPSIRSAVQLLFRPAAESGNGAAQARPLTLNGITISMADLRNADSLRAMLQRLTDAAVDASPQDAEQFLIALMDQLASLSPADLRSLAIDLARDRNLLKQLDATTKALSLRLLSKDLELHLSLSLAAVIQRDPDRMLLLAEALPPSRTRDEFLSRTLSILAVDRPEAVLALLNGPDAPLKGSNLVQAGGSALETLAARSLESLMGVMKDLKDSQLKWYSRQILVERINEQPEAVFAWMDSVPEEGLGSLTAAALSFAEPETARRWLDSPAALKPENTEAFLRACGKLAKSDPAAALDWLKKLPAKEGGPSIDLWRVGGTMENFSAADLKTVLPGMSAENQELLLPLSFKGKPKEAAELVELSGITQDLALQQRMATEWARTQDPVKGTRNAESLPSGPLREASLAVLGSEWSRRDPAAWLDWMRAATPADQTAAMSQADPKVWSDPKNAAFLTSRPPSEQLPWLASIYHDNAQSAASVIEQASTQGASPASLDAAAKSLAESWQDRDPATARAFAQSLPDPAMVDSVLSSMAGTSATIEARAAAVAAIQNPITRQQAERAAALRDTGIIPPPRKQ